MTYCCVTQSFLNDSFGSREMWYSGEKWTWAHPLMRDRQCAKEIEVQIFAYTAKLNIDIKYG